VSTRPTLQLPSLPDLAEELERLVSQLPAGSLTTYGDLARALGNRHAAISVSKWARAKAIQDPAILGRVVSKEAAADKKRFTEFSGTPPLRPLETWLLKAAAFVGEAPLKARPRLVAGIDVAYPAPDRATAAAVLVDARAKKVIHELIIERPVVFPYITGFLTFRELPAMLAACEALVRAAGLPDVVMIDGQGRLHPHRGGVATGFAAASGLPTIGVAKSLLCGKLEPSSELSGSPFVERVLVEDEPLGFAVRTTPTSAPIYVSVGGWLSLDDALGITLPLLSTTRLPLPTHRADRLSKKRQPDA
jgi:deoxyribonuclease V